MPYFDSSLLLIIVPALVITGTVSYFVGSRLAATDDPSNLCPHCHRTIPASTSLCPLCAQWLNGNYPADWPIMTSTVPIDTDVAPSIGSADTENSAASEAGTADNR